MTSLANPEMLQSEEEICALLNMLEVWHDMHQAHSYMECADIFGEGECVLDDRILLDMIMALYAF